MRTFKITLSTLIVCMIITSCLLFFKIQNKNSENLNIIEENEKSFSEDI